MKLLIVDDSSIIRSRIARIMSDPRLPSLMIVGMARNGAEALELFSQTQPDLVTMDLTMPEMDGVECTESMTHLNADAGILVVSALSDKATAIKALKKGAKGFLYKPFTDEQLVNALLEMMS
ncbi:MAG: response regulator [Betaproteobacteria bacterium]|nr:response regulator [Betaproteobacteria bacterium]